MKIIFSALSILILSACNSSSSRLVTDEVIDTQKDQTEILYLKNKIPVLFRQVPGSDIVQLDVGFAFGRKDIPAGSRGIQNWLWPAMSLGGKGYPKEKLFTLKERYAVDIGCDGGLESSHCGLSTINAYWDKGLPALASVVRTPLFQKEDTDILKQRLMASLKSTPESPGAYTNEILNRIFYPKKHPYRLNYDEALRELPRVHTKHLTAFHKHILNGRRMMITVVSSLDQDKVLGDLNKYFGDIPVANYKASTPAPPPFDSKQAVAFEHRPIPTAYILAKFPLPGIKEPDALAARFMMEILSDELWGEIRTKRSLSYAVGAGSLPYSLGLGVISASTSKPKETFEALAQVIQKMKTKRFSQEEIKEHKTAFATNYFLTLEEHASLANAMSNYFHYFGETDRFYEMPKELAKIGAKDIQRLAQKYLVNMRVGVLYDKALFKKSWADHFVQTTSSKKAH